MATTIIVIVLFVLFILFIVLKSRKKEMQKDYPLAYEEYVSANQLDFASYYYVISLVKIGIRSKKQWIEEEASIRQRKEIEKTTEEKTRKEREERERKIAKEKRRKEEDIILHRLKTFRPSNRRAVCILGGVLNKKTYTHHLWAERVKIVQVMVWILDTDFKTMCAYRSATTIQWLIDTRWQIR